MSQYFTIVAEKISWITTDLDGGNTTLKKKIDTFQTTPCNQLTSQQLDVYSYISSETYNLEKLRNFGICPLVPANFSVQGKGSDDLFSLFRLKVMPCSLTNGCKLRISLGTLADNLVVALSAERTSM